MLHTTEYLLYMHIYWVFFECGNEMGKEKKKMNLLVSYTCCVSLPWRKWPHIRETHSSSVLETRSPWQRFWQSGSLSDTTEEEAFLPVIASHCPGRTDLVSWGFNFNLCLHTITISLSSLCFVRTSVTLDKQSVLIQCVLIQFFLTGSPSTSSSSQLHLLSMLTQLYFLCLV